MNWVLGDQQVELTDGTKGICISTYVHVSVVVTFAKLLPRLAKVLWSRVGFLVDLLVFLRFLENYKSDFHEI